MLADGLLVQAGFEAAQQPPVHQSNPSLEAVEVLPGEVTVASYI